MGFPGGRGGGRLPAKGRQEAQSAKFKVQSSREVPAFHRGITGPTGGDRWLAPLNVLHDLLDAHGANLAISGSFAPGKPGEWGTTAPLPQRAGRMVAHTTGSGSASLSPIPDVRNRRKIQHGESLRRLRTSGMGEVRWFSWICSGAANQPGGMRFCILHSSFCIPIHGGEAEAVPSSTMVGT